jgi:hypothetical protein
VDWTLDTVDSLISANKEDVKNMLQKSSATFWPFLVNLQKIRPDFLVGPFCILRPRWKINAKLGMKKFFIKSAGKYIKSLETISLECG